MFLEASYQHKNNKDYMKEKAFEFNFNYIFLTIVPVLFGAVVFFLKRFVNKTDKKFETIDQRHVQSIKDNAKISATLDVKLNSISNEYIQNKDYIKQKIFNIDKVIDEHEEKIKLHESLMVERIATMRSEGKEVMDAISHYSSVFKNIDNIVSSNDCNMNKAVEHFEILSTKIKKLESIISKSVDSQEINTESLNRVNEILNKFGADISKLKEFKKILIDRSEEISKNPKGKNKSQSLSDEVGEKNNSKISFDDSGETNNSLIKPQERNSRPKVIKTLFKGKDRKK